MRFKNLYGLSELKEKLAEHGVVIHPRDEKRKFSLPEEFTWVFEEVVKHFHKLEREFSLDVPASKKEVENFLGVIVASKSACHDLYHSMHKFIMMLGGKESESCKSIDLLGSMLDRIYKFHGDLVKYKLEIRSDEWLSIRIVYHAEDVTIEHGNYEYNFGGYQICLEILVKPDKDSFVVHDTVKTYPYNSTICVQGYPHPHVSSGGGSCLGEGNSVFRRSIRDFNLARAFGLLNSWVRSYGQSNPYLPIERWRKPRCFECKKEFRETQLITKSDDGSKYCSVCWGKKFVVCSCCSKLIENGDEATCIEMKTPTGLFKRYICKECTW